MTTPARRITAPKPERRRDVSGFDVITRAPPAPPSPSIDGSFADWLSDDDPFEVTIDLRSAPDDAEAPHDGQRVVDVEIVQSEDEESR